MIQPFTACCHSTLLKAKTVYNVKYRLKQIRVDRRGDSIDVSTRRAAHMPQPTKAYTSHAHAGSYATSTNCTLRYVEIYGQPFRGSRPAVAFRATIGPAMFRKTYVVRGPPEIRRERVYRISQSTFFFKSKT